MLNFALFSSILAYFMGNTCSISLLAQECLGFKKYLIFIEHQEAASSIGSLKRTHATNDILIWQIIEEKEWSSWVYRKNILLNLFANSFLSTLKYILDIFKEKTWPNPIKF